MTLQGQESADQPRWTANPDDSSARAGIGAGAANSAGTGSVSDGQVLRKDSSDINAPSGELAAPLSQPQHGVSAQNGTHTNGPSATSQNTGKADASPFHLEPSSTGGALSNAPVAKADNAPATKQEVKLESSANASFIADTTEQQAEAGPGPSTTANAVKRDYAAMSQNPLKRRKLNAAGYSEIEKLSHYAREAQIDIALQIDQACTQHPCLTPFESHQDAVDRLWSWHIWQTYDSELDLPETKTGQAADALAEKTASALVGRVKGVRERWEKMRRKVDQAFAEGIEAGAVGYSRASSAWAAQIKSNNQAPVQHPETTIPILTDIQTDFRQLNQTYRDRVLGPRNLIYGDLQRREAARNEAIERQRQKEEEARLLAQRQAREAAAARERARIAEIKAAQMRQAVADVEKRDKEREAKRLAAQRAEEAKNGVGASPAAGASASPQTPTTPNPGPSTPTATRQPVSTSSPAAPAASTPASTPTRGRGRGRPRGSGRAGMHQAVVTHQAHAQARAAQGQAPSTPGPGASTGPNTPIRPPAVRPPLATGGTTPGPGVAFRPSTGIRPPPPVSGVPVPGSGASPAPTTAARPPYAPGVPTSSPGASPLPRPNTAVRPSPASSMSTPGPGALSRPQTGIRPPSTPGVSTPVPMINGVPTGTRPPLHAPVTPGGQSIPGTANGTPIRPPHTPSAASAGLVSSTINRSATASSNPSTGLTPSTSAAARAAPAPQSRPAPVSSGAPTRPSGLANMTGTPDQGSARGPLQSGQLSTPQQATRIAPTSALAPGTPTASGRNVEEPTWSKGDLKYPSQPTVIVTRADKVEMMRKAGILPDNAVAGRMTGDDFKPGMVGRIVKVEPDGRHMLEVCLNELKPDQLRVIAAVLGLDIAKIKQMNNESDPSNGRPINGNQPLPHVSSGSGPVVRPPGPHQGQGQAQVQGHAQSPTQAAVSAQASEQAQVQGKTQGGGLSRSTMQPQITRAQPLTQAQPSTQAHPASASSGVAPLQTRGQPPSPARPPPAQAQAPSRMTAPTSNVPGTVTQSLVHSTAAPRIATQPAARPPQAHMSAAPARPPAQVHDDAISPSPVMTTSTSGSPTASAHASAQPDGTLDGQAG